MRLPQEVDRVGSKGDVKNKMSCGKVVLSIDWNGNGIHVIC